MGEKETLSTGERSEASGGAIAIDEEGVQRKAKEGATLAMGEEEVQRASNLNSSKSNVYREGGGEPEPEAATTVKSSKSNSSERLSYPDGGEPGAAGIAVSDPGAGGSKSNTKREGGGPAPEPAEGSNLNSTKSNS